MPRRRISYEERKATFWDRVSKGDGCWEWQGARDGAGYGALSVNGRVEVATRFAWEITHGPIAPGLVVRHKCDNPPCVRPDHLELGTPKDNQQDKAQRGRSARGEKNHLARMTVALVGEVRRLAATGVSISEIERRTGISHNALHCAITRKTWKHVP